MDIKPLETVEEFHGALRVNNLAWKAAYRDLLPDAVIEGIPSDPPMDVAEERFDDLEVDGGVFLIAVDDDGVTRGYIYVRWEDTKDFVGTDEAGLKEIYVHPDWWGQGIGTRLLDGALEAVPPSIEAIRLEMLSGNETAHEFYRSRGFELDGQSAFKIAGDTYPTDIYVRQL